MKKELLNSVLFTLFMLFTNLEAHADNYITCSSCSSIGAMQSKAKSYIFDRTNGDSMSSTYIVHLVSIPNGIAGSFRVTSRPELNRFGEIETTVTARRSSTPQHLIDQAKRAQSYMYLAKKTRVPASSGYRSAWEMARNSSSRDRFDDWAAQNDSLKYWSTQIISIFGGLFYDPLAGIELLFEFEDGSQLIMKAATLRSGTKLRLSYTRHSAIDSDGNRIPDAGTSIEGTYQFSSQYKLEQYIQKAAEYGIRVRVIYSGVRGRVTIVPINRT
ncbi:MULTISPECIES: hypothetical protein [Pseudoalteromonas]|uniref:Uncharacterized protein n=1 Tax=Pseudoalteromonas luteoviolacea (strain 2ta16) TaxID=1353533 RepID=V4H5G2_PSEL2|nr:MULTISPECIES: hypothetical protein [Pseudoalteromonas]ESP92731.1 hypothetical protein PL2TA16_03929 [Pseudoalteromonas luteoviolacea 2ta16]KZN35542.1 hypothetical protein N483_00890 [Pseudoalteromonas luteoviolacea NCIMB 1944]MCG7546489.1 hypothetical protein [Pseudoalteromonas sp. Of7M-16]